MEKIEFELKKQKILNNIFACMFLLMIGGMTNLNAIVSNGGKMPVLSNYYFESEKHYGVLDLSEVNFPWLVDRFQIKGQDWTYSYSLGDIFIYLFGLITFLLISYLTYFEIKYRKVFKERIYKI
jgi:hypothetical protein